MGASPLCYLRAIFKALDNRDIFQRYQACSKVRTHNLEKQEWNYGRNLFSPYFLSSCQDYNCNCSKTSDNKITDFSFKKSAETFAAFLVIQLNALFCGTKSDLIEFFRKIADATICNCLEPPPRATA